MNTYLDLNNWPRAEHFEFFRSFDEPFFGVTVDIDCTQLYLKAKQSNTSFFIQYLYNTMRAVNGNEPFRYRIEKNRVLVHDRIDASATISRPDGSFGFSLIEYNADFDCFNRNCKSEIERVKNTPGLFTRRFDKDNLIHFSSIPWISFTSLSHARSFISGDSCPKISFGKMIEAETGKCTMPMSVHVHHALMDGFHVGAFIDSFQQFMLE